MMDGSFRKYIKGRSGAFTPEYHQLLGKTPWIVVRRLLRSNPPNMDRSSDTIEAQTTKPSLPTTSSAAHELSEGDIATVFSQFGDVVDVRFVRNRKTGKFLGTAFVKFADYRSGIAAADDMNSCFEDNDLVVLSISEDSTAQAVGITVERCEEVEVPSRTDPSSESYPEWVRRVRGE